MIPVTPIPYIDESAASYLMRVAQHNYHKSVNQLLSHRYNLSERMSLISDIHSRTSFKQLMDLLEIDQSLTSDLALDYCNLTTRSGIRYNELNFPYSFFRKDGTGFCPICLAEEHYFRQSWRFKPYFGCLKHSVYILDCCPNCKKELNPLRGIITRCNRCDFDLTKSPTTSCDIEKIDFFVKLFSVQGQLAANDFSYLWRSVEKLLLKRGISPTPEYMTELIYSAFNTPKEASATLEKKLGSSTTLHIELCLFGFDNDEYPASKIFFNALKSHLNVPYLEKAAASVTINKKQACMLLNISYHKLMTKIRKGEIEWPTSKKRGETINADELLRKIEKPNKIHETSLFEPTIDYAYYSIADAAKRLNIHAEVVRSLISKGWLNSERRNVAGISRYVISHEFLEEFDRKYICVGALAKLRNVNPTNLADKLAHLGISPVDGPKINGLLTTLFHRNQASRISRDEILGIKNYATKAGRKPKQLSEVLPPDPKKPLNLKEASKILEISSQKVAVLVRKGILELDHKTNMIYIKHDTFQTLQSKLYGGGFITVEDASKVVGCTPSWIYINLINNKMISLIDCIYWKFITIQDMQMIKKIKEKYFTATEASLYLGMHRHHINNQKKLGKIKPSHIDSEKKLDLYYKWEIEELKANFNGEQ